MTKFPSSMPKDVATFFEGYMGEMNRAAATVSREALDKARSLLIHILERDASIYACGNGGSAAIVNHLVCDFGKGVRTDTYLRPRVRSLAAGPEVLTAIGNDIGYADTFSLQLEAFARPGDLLITVSSSGDSENIVRAVQWAKTHEVSTLALTGFSGGRSAKLADVNLHVTSQNYGVVEDVHQTLLHVLMQHLRLSHMPSELIGQRTF
jgi:D-sedoheptulose 7-phosphate isomerase